MKRRILTALFTLVVATSLVACGGEVKTINNTSGGSNSSDQNSANSGAEAPITGFVFTYNGVSMGADLDFNTVYDALGKETTYFEAPSCAFEGIDKVYTYNHFEVDTYPDGEMDRIQYIFLLDDIVSTEEGACIGMSAQEITDIYGACDDESNGSLTYTKEGMKLTFVIEGDSVTSIQYASSVL